MARRDRCPRDHAGYCLIALRGECRKTRDEMQCITPMTAVMRFRHQLAKVLWLELKVRAPRAWTVH